MAQVVTPTRPLQNAQERLDSATRTLLLIVVAFIPAAIILAVRAAVGFGPLQYPAAMDYAQLARNISAGDGFTTNQLTPLAVEMIRSGTHITDLTHPPLYPVALAMLFGIFGASDSVVVAASMGFYALSTVMAFLIARRQFSLMAAAIASALFATQFELVKYAVSGTSVMASTFMLLVLWYMLTGPGVHTPKHYFKAGAIFGLCYLTQYSFALLLPVILIYVFCTASARRGYGVIAFLIGTIIVSSPWLVRNALLTHNPFFTLDQYDILMNTGSYPSYDVHRSFGSVPSLLLYPVTHSFEMASKVLNGIVQMYWQWPILVGLYVVPFFVLSLFLRVKDGNLLANRRLLIALMIISTIGVCLGDQMPMHLAIFAPLAIIFAAGYLLYITERLLSVPARRVMLISTLVLGAAIPTVVGLAKSTSPVPAGIPRQFSDLDEIVSKDSIVVSDCPWAVAWYGRRTAIWLPLNPGQLTGMERKIGRVDAAFISRYAASFTSVDSVALIKQFSQLGGADNYRIVRAYKSGDVILARQ